MNESSILSCLLWVVFRLEIRTIALIKMRQEKSNEITILAITFASFILLVLFIFKCISLQISLINVLHSVCNPRIKKKNVSKYTYISAPPLLLEDNTYTIPFIYTASCAAIALPCP